MNMPPRVSVALEVLRLTLSIELGDGLPRPAEDGEEWKGTAEQQTRRLTASEMACTNAAWGLLTGYLDGSIPLDPAIPIIDCELVDDDEDEDLEKTPCEN